MKKTIKVICGFVVVLSILALLYGSIKFARVQNALPILNINTDIPGAIIKNTLSSHDEKGTIQVIIGTSLVTFFLSVAGFWICSKKVTTSLD